MGRSRSEIMASLPKERRKAVEARTAELIAEVEGLQALRKLTEQSQADMAAKLKIKQPSVHKIEKQTDMYLTTLRRYVEAAGGTLELRVKLPGRETIHLTRVGDLG